MLQCLRLQGQTSSPVQATETKIILIFFYLFVLEMDIKTFCEVPYLIVNHQTPFRRGSAPYLQGRNASQRGEKKLNGHPFWVSPLSELATRYACVVRSHFHAVAPVVPVWWHLHEKMQKDRDSKSWTCGGSREVEQACSLMLRGGNPAPHMCAQNLPDFALCVSSSGCSFASFKISKLVNSFPEFCELL